LGYGKGELKYTIKGAKGIWSFESEYGNNIHDGLPEDSWIGFLQTRTGKVSTRTDVRPFTIDEQKRILIVGACLSCHDEDSRMIKESLVDYKKILAVKSERCILPFWKN